MSLKKLREDLVFMECGKSKTVKLKTKKQIELIAEKCKKKEVDCKYFLQKKIRVNMKEREVKQWSVPQALAISYSQVKKMFPSCDFEGKTKSPVRIKVQKGGLEGYSLKLKVVDRKKALDKLVLKHGWGNVVKKLNLLAIYSKNNYPANSLKFRKDMGYVQLKYRPFRK